MWLACCAPNSMPSVRTLYVPGRSISVEFSRTGHGPSYMPWSGLSLSKESGKNSYRRSTILAARFRIPVKKQGWFKIFEFNITIAVAKELKQASKQFVSWTWMVSNNLIVRTYCFFIEVQIKRMLFLNTIQNLILFILQCLQLHRFM